MNFLHEDEDEAEWARIGQGIGEAMARIPGAQAFALNLVLSGMQQIMSPKKKEPPMPINMEMTVSDAKRTIKAAFDELDRDEVALKTVESNTRFDFDGKRTLTLTVEYYTNQK